MSVSDNARAIRHFGRYQLLRLLGRSVRTMAWLVQDPDNGRDRVLMSPRQQPASDAELQAWLQRVQQTERLRHPGLAPVIEVGQQNRWPYVMFDRGERVTLAEKLSVQGLPTAELARWFSQALGGLAVAHDAGLVHGDLQAFDLVLDDAGNCSVMGLEVAWEHAGGTRDDAAQGSQALQQQRRNAERDVLAVGLLLSQAVCGEPPLGQPDLGLVIEQLPPRGRQIVRLPMSGPRPVSEALRAIINRATDRQERQRYRSARTLAHALDGWRIADVGVGGGPLALLLDRLRHAGVLPSLPGNAARASRLALMERERTSELAEVVLEDPALSLELLRMANAARGKDSGAILTERRAIAMLGLDGVRRCSLALRDWPGPLNPAAAAELQKLIGRVKQAARAAQLLRPAGFDAELVQIIVLLQNLGRLVVQYHFAEQALQIRKLMQGAPAPRPGEPDEPGMDEEAAAFAVLGAGVEELGQALARHWGFEDDVLLLARRMPLESSPQGGEADADILRATASCANELVDALQLYGAKAGVAVQKVAQRYGRPLKLGVRELTLASQGLPVEPEEQALPQATDS